MASTISGIGFRPVRGNWEKVMLPTASAATFQTWAPLDFDGTRMLIEATSASTQILGVAMSYSTASTPSQISVNGPNWNCVLVAIPMDSSAVARTSILSTVVASALSIGQVYNIDKLYNNLGLNVTSQASAKVQIRGNFDSATSQVDVQILGNVVLLPSYASVTNP